MIHSPSSLSAGLEPYLAELAAIAPLEEGEERALSEAAAGGDAAARERLVLAHLSWVVKIACQYGGYGLPLADLISEGNLGLLRAAELFDPSFGIGFSTYARVWVKQRIHRAITAQARAVRIPVWRSQRLRKLDRLHEELAAELGRDCEVSDLAQRLGMTEETISRLEGERLRVESIDSDEGASLSAAWCDPLAAEPGERLSREELFEEIAACLHGLDDTELQVLSLKFGLLDDEPESYREMAPRFGKSREWIRRIGETALAKAAASLQSLGHLPRAIVEARREKTRVRLRALAKKKAAFVARLSLFQVVLMEQAEFLMPVFA